MTLGAQKTKKRLSSSVAILPYSHMSRNRCGCCVNEAIQINRVSRSLHLLDSKRRRPTTSGNSMQLSFRQLICASQRAAVLCRILEHFHTLHPRGTLGSSSLSPRIAPSVL